MKFWKIIITANLIVLLISNLALAQSSPPTTSAHFGVHPPEIDIRFLNVAKPFILANRDSLELSKTGDSYAAHGAWKDAGSYYQQALDKWANNQDALYGMAKYIHLTGNTAKEIEYYRSAIYLDTPKGKDIQESSPKRLMEFAILLAQSKQIDEGLFIYHYAAANLNYRDGKQNLKVLLPELVEERLLPEQVRYTPERLQALADTALAHEELGFGSDKEALAHMQEAVKLFPESPVTHFYLGEALSRKDPRAAKAAYRKAAELGDAGTRAAANDRLGVSK
jgi:hypothetical protein